MKVLFIVGSVRSGSTLLQHLLATQGNAVALGEVHRLHRIAASGEECACGLPLSRCLFWGGIAHELGVPLDQLPCTPSGSRSRRLVAAALEWTAIQLRGAVFARRLLISERNAAANCFAVYQAASRLTGKNVVVDASKVAFQFLHLYLHYPDMVRPVFLIRDGRATTWSMMRRTGIDAGQASRIWLYGTLMMLAVRQLVPQPMRTFIRYEELCSDPSAALETILNPLAVKVRSAETFIMPQERHDLGGSPAFKARNLVQVTLDERWQREMVPEALVTFDRIAGSVNRWLGYR